MTKYILILALAGACNGAIMSSYGGRYRDSARARTVRIENYRREHDTSNKDFRFCKLSVRKYHPDSLCCAVGWRCMKGCILWIQYGMMRVRVKASDVMAPGYNDTLELHVDVSWRVYKALGVKHRCEVIVTVDSQSLKIKMKKLNIGCGSDIKTGFVNADIDASRAGVDLVCSLEKIPVPDSEFDVVWSQHSIEHVPFATARLALREWYRVLKRGGLLHVDTPNIERNIKLFLQENWMQDFNTLTPEEKLYCSFDGKPNKTLWLNFKIFSSDKPFDVHFGNYDAPLLTAFMQEAGFTNIKLIQYDPSLILEATKP